MNNHELNTDLMHLLIIMSDGNLWLLNILIGLIPNHLREVMLCYYMGFSGIKLYMLYNDCCCQNNEKFVLTINLLNSGLFKRDEIDKNFNLDRAIPFIDDSISTNDFSFYDKCFKRRSPEWLDFCSSQYQAFTKKMIKKKPYK